MLTVETRASAGHANSTYAHRTRGATGLTERSGIDIEIVCTTREANGERYALTAGSNTGTTD